MKKLLVGLVATTTLFVAACGGDDDTATSTTAAAAATETETTTAAKTETTEAAAPQTSAAAAETTAKATATTAAATTTAAAPAASGGTVAVVLEDDPWSIKANAAVPAGKVSFSVTNEGGFPHELVVFKGSYADLAKSDIGAVLEDEVAAGALIGRTDRVAAGSSAKLDVDLAPGKYSLICNISAGPNSHAGKGQVLDITVG